MSDQQRVQILRLLDANINRAAEGLRTIEEVARLVREDRTVAAELKALRHQLANLCQDVSRTERLAARAVDTDAGTEITTHSEGTRNDWSGVVSAAAERVTQSLRSLEEFSKFLSSQLGERFKQLRYAAYDVLAQAELRLQNVRPPIRGQLYLLVDCNHNLDAFRAYIGELAAAGVDYFQIRDKSANAARLMQFSRAAIDSLQNSQAQLIVNDRVDIALAAGAAGVHVGQEDMSLEDARRISQGRLLIGVSTHSLDQAVAAEQGGADYIGCGPTFPSTTKEFEAFPGLPFIKQVAETIRIPAFAIGGIGRENLSSLGRVGCQRIAVSAAIHQAANSLAAARELRSLLDGDPRHP